MSVGQGGMCLPAEWILKHFFVNLEHFGCVEDQARIVDNSSITQAQLGGLSDIILFHLHLREFLRMSDFLGESPDGGNGCLGGTHVIHTLLADTEGLGHHGIGIRATLNVKFHTFCQKDSIGYAVRYMGNSTDGMCQGVYISNTRDAECPSGYSGCNLHLAPGNEIASVLYAYRQVSGQKPYCMDTQRIGYWFVR